jgi:hypothetical protein
LVFVAVVLVGFGASEFEDFAVLDAGWAGGFTGSATEATVDCGVGFGCPIMVFVGYAGESDSATGGLAFVAGYKECGAGFEAEAAADALGCEVAEL